MSDKEYRLATAAQSGLLYIRGVPGVALGDRVTVRDHRGRRRNGQVIRTSEELVLIQVLEGTDNLDLERTWVRFLDQPFEIALSPDLLGRAFNGLGQPRDDLPPLFSPLKRNVNGTPVNPAARAYPREFIQTGLSAIDGLNVLVRGQKLPIFSGSGLPHNRLAAQIVRQARLPGEESRFAVVFAAMGVSYADARFFRETFADSGVLRNVVMFLNLADEPAIERLILPRAALTAAEYLAFDLDLHVLVVMTDITHYAEALREVATAKGDVPARKGYPGYLYSDLAEIYERAGRIRNKPGSITMIPILSMPSDDITHPIPDLTGYITEGQLVLTRALNNLGIYPPIDVPPSLSRLMKDGIGKDHTRDDHARVRGANLRLLRARPRGAQPRFDHRRRGPVRDGPELPHLRQRVRAAFRGTARGRGTQRRRNPRPRLGPAFAVAAGGADPRGRGGPGQIPPLARRGGGGKMKGLLRVPPTKSTLLSLRRQVAALQDGHDLLERKRELLTRLVHQRLRNYRELRKKVGEALQGAYHWLSIAQMRMGITQLQQAVVGLESPLSVYILPRSSVGVEYPTVTVETAPLQPVGLMWTDASFDEARQRMADVAILLAQLGEAETALGRLLNEQRKTQKRVNALKYNVIPRYKNTISYIEFNSF